MSVDWGKQYARRLDWMTTSVIRDIFKVLQATDIISLAGGWPEADLFPVEQFIDITQYVLNEMPKDSLQYGSTDGFVPLRETLAAFMTAQGVPALKENIVITSGSMQALDLMGRITIDEGDTVLVESPTFLGALQGFNAYGCKYETVPLDSDGLIVEELEKVLKRTHPKFMYLLPTFQNPAGVTLSLERRIRVVDLAAEYGVPIVEDDPYGQLRFAGDPLPSLVQLSAAKYAENSVENGYAIGDVVYLSTFSKTLAPGLRLAWAVCPPEMANQFVMAKQGADLHSNSLAQTMAYEFMRRGWLPDQVMRIRDTYRERCNAMCDAIDTYFPEGATYTRPQGGLFLWVNLPKGMDSGEILKQAAEAKVAFIPGAPFYANGGGEDTIRLSYASVPIQTIREGVKRLGDVLKRNLA